MNHPTPVSPAPGGDALTVTVALDQRSYAIHIGAGLLDNSAAMIQEAGQWRRCAVITDEAVAKHHLETLQHGLEVAGLAVDPVILPAGEATKSFAQLEPLCEALLMRGIERGDAVIALGGGVIGDLAGFAASILRRGVALIQVPTTLLAQVDSSVGGKTGINTPQGKNLVGTFHQPRLVIADTDTLNTLPARELRAGYAEIVKYGLLGDAEFFAWLEQNGLALIRGDAPARAHAIERSCRMKADIVAADEREFGRRALLNLGHTFGHALEAWAGYSGNLLHGEAVSIGMGLAFKLSEQMGLCPPGSHERVTAHLRTVGLPVTIGDLGAAGRGIPEPAELITHMMQDKKVSGGKLTFILARDIGEAFIARDVDTDNLKRLLSEECRGS
ncbi:MAG: 3-dehydroquinate synthase [Dichotomicrobium sp.]